MSSEELEDRSAAKKAQAEKAGAAAGGSGARKSVKKKPAKKAAAKAAKKAATRAATKARAKAAKSGRETAARPDPEPAAARDALDAPKIDRLPAFGFAEDLLRELKGQASGKPSGPPSSGQLASGPRASRPRASREETSASPAADADAPPPEPRSREATVDDDASPPAPASQAGGRQPADDPERIFAFADTLDEERAEPSEVVPVRLTSWVTFELSGEVYALPVEPVREVLRVASVTRVPHAPRPIRGVTNLRGRVIPVIDLRVRIGLDQSTIGRSTRVIVVASRGRLLGLLVDAVHQVAHIDLNQVQPPPDDVMTVQSDYITGVVHLGEQLVLLLDVDRALVVRDEPGSEEQQRASGAA